MKHAANVAVPVVEETGIKQDTTNITEILKHTVPPKKAEPIVTVWTANHIEAPKPNPLYVNIKSRLFDAKSKKEIVEPEPVKFEYPPKESLSKYEQALYSVLVKEESDTYSSIINSKKEFPIEAWSDFDNIWDIELQNNEERLGTSYSCHAPYTAIEYNGGYTKYPKVSNKAYTEKSVKSTGNIKIRPMNFSRPNLPQPEKKQNDNQKMIQISLVPKAIESESLLSSLDSCFTEQPTEVEKKDLSISPKRFSHKNKRPELLSWKQERQNLNSIGELARVLKPRVRTPPKYQISSFKKDASVNLNEEMDRYDDFQRVRFTSKVLDRNNGRILKKEGSIEDKIERSEQAKIYNIPKETRQTRPSAISLPPLQFIPSPTELYEKLEKLSIPIPTKIEKKPENKIARDPTLKGIELSISTSLIVMRT